MYEGMPVDCSEESCICSTYQAGVASCMHLSLHVAADYVSISAWLPV